MTSIPERFLNPEDAIDTSYIYIYMHIHIYIYIFTKIKVTTMVVTCCSGTTPFSTAPVGQRCQGAKTGAAAADTFGPNRFHGVLAAQWDGLSGSRSSKNKGRSLV